MWSKNGWQGIRTWSFSRVADRDVNIQRMKKASRIATGRTKNNLAFPERSLIVPTFSTSSSTSEARKNVAPSMITLEERPPSVGFTTPKPMETTRMIMRETVLLTTPAVTAQIVIPVGRSPVLFSSAYSKYQIIVSKAPRMITREMQFWSGRISVQNLAYWENQKTPKITKNRDMAP